MTARSAAASPRRSRVSRRPAPAGTVSRLAFPASALIALSALAGCGGAKEPVYTPKGRCARRSRPRGFRCTTSSRSSTGGHACRRRRPPPPPEPVTRPLTALLNGVRAAVIGPTARNSTRSTTLRSFQLDVFVYPREKDARRRVAGLANLLAAQQILHRVGFGFERRANVVVTYRLYQYERGVPRIPRRPRARHEVRRQGYRQRRSRTRAPPVETASARGRGQPSRCPGRSDRRTS